MSSVALERWHRERAARLLELVTAQQRLGVTGADPSVAAQQLNWALVLQLSAEFQGFARDLHAHGAETFALWTAGGNSELESILGPLLVRRLQIDRGNATPDSLAEAFGRFGLEWWPALRARDQETFVWEQALRELNAARNAIAHSQLGEIDRLREAGLPLTLATFQRWHAALDGMAGTMDRVLADHLAAVFARPAPW